MRAITLLAVASVAWRLLAEAADVSLPLVVVVGVDVDVVAVVVVVMFVCGKVCAAALATKA